MATLAALDGGLTAKLGVSAYGDREFWPPSSLWQGCQGGQIPSLGHLARNLAALATLDVGQTGNVRRQQDRAPRPAAARGQGPRAGACRAGPVRRTGSSAAMTTNCLYWRLMSRRPPSNRTARAIASRSSPPVRSAAQKAGAKPSFVEVKVSALLVLAGISTRLRLGALPPRCRKRDCTAMTGLPPSRYQASAVWDVVRSAG